MNILTIFIVVCSLFVGKGQSLLPLQLQIQTCNKTIENDIAAVLVDNDATTIISTKPIHICAAIRGLSPSNPISVNNKERTPT